MIKTNIPCEVSIIIPVYNGASTIISLVSKLIKELVSYDFEIILINDCNKLATENNKIKFLDLSKNFGEHNAVMAGLNLCNGSCAVIMDDDFQNPPEEVVKLITKMDEKFDVVYSKYSIKNHNFLRNLGSKFHNAVASLLIGKPKGLYLSSFKIINRFVINEIIKYTGPHPYIDGLILRVTRNYSTVTVLHNKREDGKSGYTTRKLISLWINMLTNFSIMPLRLATYTGFLTGIIAILFSIYIAIEKIMNPNLPIGWATTVIAILFLGSVQLFTIGIIGEFLGRVFLKMNGTPQYIIKTKVNI
jgi:glycosyltransferase involved in cell wall biosynthesis